MTDFEKCFAYKAKGRPCKILTEKLCETTGKCKFCKTFLQLTKEQALCKLRNEEKNEQV